MPDLVVPVVTSSSFTPLVMSDVINETLDYCHRYTERPKQIVMGATAIAASTDTQITLQAGQTVNTSDVLEFGQELMLVTAVSSDATPVVTVSRGYLATTIASSVPTGTVGDVNPLYPRYQVQRAIERCFLGLNNKLPFIASETYFREPDRQYVILPANTLDVLEVGYFSTSTMLLGAADTFRYTEIGGWQFVQDLPASTWPSKILRVPSWITNDLQLVVKRRAPYAWSDTPVLETSTISLPVPANDVPVLFAAAKLVAGREVSRSELDKVEEWNHEAAIRGGVNLRLLQGMWGDYYHRLDELRGLQYVPKHRPYRKMHPLPVRKPVLFR
jgi:hypothetical protein